MSKNITAPGIKTHINVLLRESSVTHYTKALHDCINIQVYENIIKDVDHEILFHSKC